MTDETIKIEDALEGFIIRLFPDARWVKVQSVRLEEADVALVTTTTGESFRLSKGFPVHVADRADGEYVNSKRVRAYFRHVEDIVERAAREIAKSGYESRVTDIRPYRDQLVLVPRSESGFVLEVQWSPEALTRWGDPAAGFVSAREAQHDQVKIIPLTDRMLLIMVPPVP